MPLLDLPFQNGDEEWDALQSIRKRVKAEGCSIRGLLFGHVHPNIMAIMRSPLYEILCSPRPSIQPPTNFASAASRERVDINFTPAKFIKLCTRISIEWNSTKIIAPDRREMLFNMAKRLYRKKVNVLDFLSSEMTDEKFDQIPFLKLVVHTLAATKSHVVIDMITLDKWVGRLRIFQGFRHKGSRMEIRPHPPNGKTYDQEGLLYYIRDAEAHIATFAFTEVDGIESIDILHRRLHLMMDDDVKLLEFMAGREPAADNPGATMFKYIKDAVQPDGTIDCDIWFANIASDGNGMAFLQAARNDTDEPKTMTRYEATAWVDALKKADVAAIPRYEESAMRCSHCWCDWDEVVDSRNNESVHLPCNDRHMLGRDCLIDILVVMEPLCPICRRDMVEITTQSSRGSL